MTIATGAFLVLVTWVAATLIVVSVGLLPTLAIMKSLSATSLLRMSLWWGFLLTSIFALAMTLVFPLSSPQVALIGVVIVGTLGLPGWLLFRHRARSWLGPRPRWPLLGLAITGLVVTVYLAFAALAPVTNYDSGLYHLGAIRYAAEYAAIPGLANLYFPFGYGTAQFPLAALFTNGPWGIEGYRLLNGLILTLAMLDLVLRLFSSRRWPGLYVLAVGLVATWVPMVALSDYWVTSPSQDSAALVLTVVASAYVTDAVHSRQGWLAAASTAVVISTTLALIRPTMGAYLVGLVLVIGALLWRTRPSLSMLMAPAALSVTLGAIALAVTTARDRVLSGWAQYPLSAIPMDVPWRAGDPSPYREATLGYHRNPTDLWNSIEGWDWVGPWLADRVQQWETYELLSLLVAAVILLPLAVHRSKQPRLLARAVLSVAPSLVATAVWWLATPPSYRFAWGALFTLATVPIGWALWSLRASSDEDPRPRYLRKDRLVAFLMLPVLAVTVYSALFRLDWAAINQPGTVNVGVSIPVSFAPIIDVPVSEMRLESDLILLLPENSDQCWANYPLCTPDPNPSLSTIDAEWTSGFILR